MTAAARMTVAEASPRRPMATAALVALALAWAGPASASSSKHGTPGHQCACAERCKGPSCCCPREAHESAPAEVKTPAAPSPKPADAPCARSAPCGNPDLPAPGASRPIARMAALLPGAPRPAESASRSRAELDDPQPPLATASRLDDPPEA